MAFKRLTGYSIKIQIEILKIAAFICYLSLKLRHSPPRLLKTEQHAVIPGLMPRIFLIDVLSRCVALVKLYFNEMLLSILMRLEKARQM